MTAQPEHDTDTVDAEVLDLPARPDAAVVVHEEHAHSLTELMNLARVMATSKLVPEPLQGKPEDVLIVLLTSQELGLGYMQGVSGINVIKGKPAMSAELMRALVFRAGHSIDVTVEPTLAVAKGRRKDTGAESSFTFSLEEAELAGLTAPRGGRPSMWKVYPKAMLAARATSGLCRLLFPDVIAGVSYVPEELERIVIDRADQPPSTAVEVAPSEDLAAALVEVEQITDMDALRALDKAVMPHLTLPEKARLRAATTARASVLEAAAAAGADPATGEIVDAEIVDEPQLDQWGEPIKPPAESAGVGEAPTASAGTSRRRSTK